MDAPIETDTSPDMHPIRRRKMRAIEQEFGEPFFTIVCGFIAMGYSRRTICGAIGYSHLRGLKAACAGANMRWNTQKEMPIYRQREMTPRWRAAIEAVGRQLEKRYRIRAEWLTLREIATRAGMTKRGIRARVDRGERGEALLMAPMSPAHAGLIGARKTQAKLRARGA